MLSTSSPSLPPASPSLSPSQNAYQLQAVNGIAFCTLPLPILTHLPVHVNATFALTDNRRDLWLGEGIKLYNNNKNNKVNYLYDY